MNDDTLNNVMINDIGFEFSDQKTVLETVLENGYAVNHSCRDGRCQECQIKITNNGQTSLKLACQYHPSKGDKIYFDVFENYKLPNQIISPAKINSVNVLSDYYCLIEFRIPPNKDFSFFAGQYIDVNIPNVGVRSYSIYSADMNNKTLTILVSKVEGGLASNFFFKKAKKELLVTIKGPFGSFFYRPKDAEKVIFCATGSGIAPINAIFENEQIHADLSFGTEVYVLWSNKYPADFFDLSANIPTSVKYERFVTRENKKNFRSGRIVTPTLELIKRFSDREKICLYACGNPNFISELKEELTELGKLNLSFYSDAFIQNRKK